MISLGGREWKKKSKAVLVEQTNPKRSLLRWTFPALNKLNRFLLMRIFFGWLEDKYPFILQQFVFWHHSNNTFQILDQVCGVFFTYYQYHWCNFWFNHNLLIPSEIKFWLLRIFLVRFSWLQVVDFLVLGVENLTLPRDSFLPTFLILHA